jgi:uncharacterized membrane protein SpoIIM required for sporulation
MNMGIDVNEFYTARKADWDQLTRLIERAGRGLEQFTPQDVQALGRLYRLATSDLAVAQRDYPGHRITSYLNQLVARAHGVLYRGEPLALRRIWRFIASGYPRAFRAAFPFILAAALMFALPALAAGLSAWLNPQAAVWLLPQEVQDLIPMIEKQELWVDIPISERPYASSFIMQNNIQVSFLAFAGGVTGGLLTTWVMVMNGLILGGLTGLTGHYGVGFDLWTFVIGHGVVELSVIFIAGGAGLMVGWGLLRPGLFRRRDALAQEAQKAVRLLAGCVPLLIFAGLIEGFISPAQSLPWFIKWGVGLLSGAVLYTYLVFAGRKP